jgi:hypothetical protein
MHLQVHIPNVEPELYQMPTECPQERCSCTLFKRRQDECSNRCLRCGHTFRVHVQGVTLARQSDALKGFSVLLYLPGLAQRDIGNLSNHRRGMLRFYTGCDTMWVRLQAPGTGQIA